MTAIARFKTETGSNYEIFRNEDGELCWARITQPSIESSIPLRTKTGLLIEMPIILLNEPVVMYGPPLSIDCGVRAISTSRVIAMELMNGTC